MDELKSRKRVLRRYHYALLSEIKYVKLVTVFYFFNLYPNIDMETSESPVSCIHALAVAIAVFFCFCLVGFHALSYDGGRYTTCVISEPRGYVLE